MAGDCPTCSAIEAVLRAGRVPSPIAKRVSRSGTVRKADKVLKSQITRQAIRSRSKVEQARDALRSKAMKKANAKGRKKNGQMRSGYTQAMIMKEAHRLMKLEMKKK